ncbi:MAG: V-type ATP synthase subunit I [Oscillospiraceae bacterium]|nr:V-type ATP synthase subunit I [Oscillospiraceae bacterium]
MSIAKMKKLSLMGLCRDTDELLQRLMELGCVEISATRQSLTPEESALFVKTSLDDLDLARDRLDRVQRALDVLKEYCPEKTGLFPSRKEITRGKLFDPMSKDEALRRTDAILELASRLHELDDEKAKVRTRGLSLEPWKGMTIPLDQGPTVSMSVLFGACPAGTDLKELEQELEEAEPLAQLEHVSTDSQQHYLVLMCYRSAERKALNALRARGFTQTVFRDLKGTAADNIAALDVETRQLEEKKAEVIGKISQYKESTTDLKICCDNLAQQIQREEAKQALVSTTGAFQLDGWFPAADEKRVRDLLGEYTCVFDVSDPDKDDDVPIKLNNNSFTRPFTLVTQMYSMPAYNGVDPNPLMAPFFVMFFGMMYADIGYGFLVSLACFIIMKKAKPKGYLIPLMFYCGIGSIIFGALSGSLFGNSVAAIGDLLGHPVTAKFWTQPLLDPLNKPVDVLLVAYVLGFIHILFGMGINAYMLIRDGDWKSALFDVGAWWLLFLGIGILAMGGTYWVAVAGAVFIVATAGRDNEGIGGKIGFGIYGLYNVTSYVGDILSYTRLMTLMLAGAVIANVVNILGSVAGTIIVFIPVFIIGHIFNMGINIIGTYVHTSRLMYLEFFGKFYREGGRLFTPLAINTKYVDIVEED